MLSRKISRPAALVTLLDSGELFAVFEEERVPAVRTGGGAFVVPSAREGSFLHLGLWGECGVGVRWLTSLTRLDVNPGVIHDGVVSFVVAVGTEFRSFPEVAEEMIGESAEEQAEDEAEEGDHWAKQGAASGGRGL